MSTKLKLAAVALFAALLLSLLLFSRPQGSPFIAVSYEHKGRYPAQETALFIVTNLTQRPVNVCLARVDVFDKGFWRNGNEGVAYIYQLVPGSKHVFSLPLPDDGERWRMRLITSEQSKGLHRILGCAQYLWYELKQGRRPKTPMPILLDRFKTNTFEFLF